VAQYVAVTAAEYDDLTVGEGSGGVPEAGRVVTDTEITPLHRVHVKQPSVS